MRIQSSASEVGHLSLEVGTLVAVADEHQPQVRHVASDLGGDPDEVVEPLRRHQAPDGHHQRVGALRPLRGEALVDAGRHHRDLRRSQARGSR